MEAIPKPSKSLIKKYDKLIEENSTNSDGYFKRGRVRMELMDYLGANQDFTQAIQKDKEHKCFEYYRERAIAKTKLKDYQSAIDDYTKAMSLLYLDDDELFLQRGILKTKIFDFNGALEDYRAAIETGKFHFYEFHLGGILKELDEYKTESKGKFWRKTAIETKQVNQLINKIKKGVKDDKCFELNEIIQDKTFKVLLQDLKENFELSKYEKLSPIEKAETEYSRGNYSQAIQILGSGNIKISKHLRLVLKLTLKCHDKTVKIDSFGEGANPMFEDITENPNYIEIEKRHNQLAPSNTIACSLKKLFDDEHIRFGKYKGDKLLNIIKNDPKYIIEEVINNTHFFVSDKILITYFFEGEVNTDELFFKALEFNLIKSKLFERWISERDNMHEDNYGNEPSWGDNRDAFDTDEQYSDWSMR